jgi:sialidase-1
MRQNILLLAVLALLTPAFASGAEDQKGETPPPRFAPSDELRGRCLEVLRKSLRSEEFWPSMHAAEALTQAGQQAEVRAALKERLESQRDDLKRCGLARELVRARDRSKTAILLDILAKSNVNGQVHAAESLYKVGEVGDGKLLRKALARDDNASLQLMAAAALARNGDRQALAVIRKRLAGTDTEEQMIAAYVVARLGDKSDIAQLRQNANREKQPLARSFAENALACLGDPAGQRAMARNLEAKDAGIRAYAAEAAGVSRAVGLADQLTKLLDDPAVDVRVRAAQALIALARPAGKPGP